MRANVGFEAIMFYYWVPGTFLRWNAHPFGQVRRKSLPAAGLNLSSGSQLRGDALLPGLQREGAGLLQSCAADQFGEGLALKLATVKGAAKP